MKLGALCSLIDDAPEVYVRFSFGGVAVKKGALKVALRDHHHGQRTAETGLTITAENFLVWTVPRDLR
jgi:hypothetical protein